MLFCHTFSSVKGGSASIGRVTNASPLLRVHRLCLTLLALLALSSLLFDTVVIHAHRHATPTTVAAQVQTAGASLDDPCALCAATATLDVLLRPEAPSWQPPVAVAFVIARVAGGIRAPQRRAHDWHSRAPPGSFSPD